MTGLTTGDIVRKMVLSHVTANDAAFHAAVQAFIASERKKNHNALAAEIEKILWSEERSAPPAFSVLGRGSKSQDAPKDKERNALLVDVKPARRSLDSLVLEPSARDAIDRVVAENRRLDLLKSHGLRPSRKLLFWGPPGCGKTAAAEALARELHLPLALVRFDALVSSYLGETASNIRKVFDFARAEPMVLFFDEFDAIGKRRSSEDHHGELKRTVNAFLQLLDSFDGDTITVAATNHQESIDPALWRRFDEVVQFDRPGIADIRELLHKRLRQIGIDGDVNLTEISDGLRGLSHSDVERIAVDATKRTILQHENHVSQNTITAAAAAHLSRARAGGPSGKAKTTRTRAKKQDGS